MKEVCLSHRRSLGPLPMSLVDRSGQVSEISLYLWILCKIFVVFIWEGGLAWFLRTRFFQPGYREKGWTFLPYEHMNKAGWLLAALIASSRIACCIVHIISIPFNCSDTAVRVAEAMIGSKVIAFVFRHVCFASRICARTLFRDLWPFLISETGLKFLLRNQSEVSPGNRASRVNRAHVKWPLVW